MKLYEISVNTIKGIDQELRVGGPASSGTCEDPGKAPWGAEFLQACADKNLPLDFFSTHPYPTFHPFDNDGSGYMQWDESGRFMADMEGYAHMLEASHFPRVERHYTEWNSSPSPRDPVHDTAFMAPFIVQFNWQGRRFTDSLSFWTISDIFEENRQGDTPFHGGFGMVNIQGLKKPSYHGYWFLSQLGEEELESGDDYCVTRHSDGRITIVMWNYCHYLPEANDSRKFQDAKGKAIYDLFENRAAKKFKINLPAQDAPIQIETVYFDRDRGSVLDAWHSIGSPNHILPSQVQTLQEKMELNRQFKELFVEEESIEFSVPAHGVVLCTLSK